MTDITPIMQAAERPSAYEIALAEAFVRRLSDHDEGTPFEIRRTSEMAAVLDKIIQAATGNTGRCACEIVKEACANLTTDY